MQSAPTIRQNSEAEVIIKEHRRWTRWIRGHQNLGEGNLTLTNRRMLFLHRIPSGSDVAANISKLRDAPLEAVLDYALALHKNNFQIPLSAIVRVGIGLYARALLPHFYLTVSYREGKKKVPRAVAFQFRRPVLQLLLQPQIVEDWKWVRAISRAIKEQEVAASRSLNKLEKL